MGKSESRRLHQYLIFHELYGQLWFTVQVMSLWILRFTRLDTCSLALLLCLSPSHYVFVSVQE